MNTSRTRLDGTPLQATHIVRCACGARPGELCRCELPPIVCLPENPAYVTWVANISVSTGGRA